MRNEEFGGPECLALCRELRRSLDEALELLDALWPDKLLLREVLEEARRALDNYL